MVVVTGERRTTHRVIQALANGLSCIVDETNGKGEGRASPGHV